MCRFVVCSATRGGRTDRWPSPAQALRALAAQWSGRSGIVRTVWDGSDAPDAPDAPGVGHAAAGPGYAVARRRHTARHLEGKVFYYRSKFALRNLHHRDYTEGCYFVKNNCFYLAFFCRYILLDTFVFYR